MSTLLATCSWPDYRYTSGVRVYGGEEANRVVRENSERFSFTRLAFFDGRLFVGSTLGVVEYEGSELIRVYKWRSGRWDTVDNLTFDRANKILWAFHARHNELLRFDGSEWETVNLPPSRSSLTREDLNYGFKGFALDSAYWIQSTREAWRWAPETHSWVRLEIPMIPCEKTYSDLGPSDCFKSIVPLEDEMLVVSHSALGVDQYWNRKIRRYQPEPDRAYLLQDGELTEVPSEPRDEFYTKRIYSAGKAAYVHSYTNALYSLTSGGLKRIPSLGKIDALATTADGRLIASFRNQGVYEYSESWVKLFDSPFVSDETGLDVKIAADEKNVALFVDSKAVASPPRLWISRDGVLVEVSVF